jgi:hypothetical protein
LEPRDVLVMADRAHLQPILFSHGETNARDITKYSVFESYYDELASSLRDDACKERKRDNGARARKG